MTSLLSRLGRSRSAEPPPNRRRPVVRAVAHPVRRLAGQADDLVPPHRRGGGLLVTLGLIMVLSASGVHS